LEQFAYVTAHDLKEPLRMVVGFVQLLEKKYSHYFDEAAMEYIQFAVEGAQRANKLLDELLLYARLSADIRLTPANMNELVDIVLQNLSVTIQEHNVQINVGELPQDAMVYQSQMIQVFQNLITNSIKFNQSETPTINISAEIQPKHYVFSVEDNGIGIPPEYAHKVFLIFKRLHTRNIYDGNGVGLAICKKIVERHHGKIYFKPASSGQGTIFYFTIDRNLNDKQALGSKK